MIIIIVIITQEETQHMRDMNKHNMYEYNE